MLVTIGKKVWSMSQIEYKKFLSEVASPEVPFGIYAVEKKNQAVIVLEHCSSVTQLKNLTRQYKAAGYKVYANGR